MPTDTIATTPDDAGRIEEHRFERRRSRTALVAGLVVAAVALVVVSLASIFLGTRDISPGQIFDTFFNYDKENTDHLVIVTLRVPRTLAGILVGVALGLAGAVMQGVARNPLADPGLLGVNAGAALGVVCAISFLGIASATGYVWFGFAGAAIVAVGVYLIGSAGREGATPVKLALAGAAVTAALQSITTAILLTDVATFDKFRFWTVGSIAGRQLELVAQIAPFIAVGVVLALCTGRLLNALSLGDDVARGLGQRVGLARALSAAAVVILCGAATAAAGPIAFLGLTIPHVARLITGPDYRW
ncbi:MAG: FecCD family ABC transporter permease, partial [Nocardioidaceae bacterium]